jgi:hypothetical protein
MSAILTAESRMNASLPVDLWGWKQGPGAERREAPPDPALIHQQGYALFSSVHYLLWAEPWPPIKERVRTGSNAIACSTSRENSSPRDLLVRRLKRNVNSSK